jgi:hypothetical protein
VFTYTNMCTVRRFGEIKQQSTRESNHYVERLFSLVGLHCPVVTASCRRMVHRLMPRCLGAVRLLCDVCAASYKGSRYCKI